MIRLSELKLPLSALPVIEQAPADEHGDSRNASQAPERVHPLSALRELAALQLGVPLADIADLHGGPQELPQFLLDFRLEAVVRKEHDHRDRDQQNDKEARHQEEQR